MDQLDTFQAPRRHKMNRFTKQKFQSQMAVETSGVECLVEHTLICTNYVQLRHDYNTDEQATLVVVAN